jgi:hypothetical protein
VLFDDGLFGGPDLRLTYDSITAGIAAEVFVDSILLSTKTDGELATAWAQIKQIAEAPLIPPTSAPGTTTAGVLALLTSLVSAACTVLLQILTHPGSLRRSFYS